MEEVKKIIRRMERIYADPAIEPLETLFMLGSHYLPLLGQAVKKAVVPAARPRARRPKPPAATPSAE